MVQRFPVQVSGTRFLIFPQSPYDGDVAPEIVELSPPRGTVGPGPSNDRMYTVEPVGKSRPYGIDPLPRPGSDALRPPWTGFVQPPAMPDANGNFDYLRPGDPGFEAAHLFAVAQFTMDVWEGFFDRPIPWHFRRDHDRLELSILPSFDNAYIGWGFLETGSGHDDDGNAEPYSLNFDVIAHEIGHAIIYSEIGIPAPGRASGEYYGFHESAADLVALIASLHFPSVVDDVLETTHGNLYTLNRLSRFAELANHKQIRMAANSYTLGDFADGWSDEHLLGQPLTGAMFDILVDVFHENLVSRGLISPQMEDLSDQLENDPAYGDVMQVLFDEQYALDPDSFRDALLEARDYIGSYLADAWSMLDSDMLTYYGVGKALEAVDKAITGGRYLSIIAGNFRMRDIGLVEPGPRLSSPGGESHSASVRTFVPD